MAVILVLLSAVLNVTMTQEVAYNITIKVPSDSLVVVPLTSSTPSTSRPSGPCDIRAMDPNFRDTVAEYISEGAKLINYHIKFHNETSNPLTEGNKWAYRPDLWSRAATRQGISLITMSFNYGMLSLTTLTFGVYHINVEVKDEPKGCFRGLTENDQISKIRDFLLVEVKTLKGDQFYQLCHQVIEKDGINAKFVDRCCRHTVDTGELKCEINKGNFWIYLLNWFLILVRVVMFFIGPIYIPKRLYSEKFETFRYLVKFKEHFLKKIYISTSAVRTDVKAKAVLDLNQTKRNFTQCKKLIKDLPHDTVIPVKIKQYDVAINYNKLLTENKVPVGLLERMARGIFHCKIRDVGAFKGCCYKDMYGAKPVAGSRAAFPWIKFWRPIGKALLVLCLPIPYYIRVYFYYKAESPEMERRKSVARSLGLEMPYSWRLVEYLSPLHPVWIFLYIIYFATAFILATSPRISHFGIRRHVRFVAYNALNALHMVCRLEGLNMVLSVFLWPMERYGILGLLIGLIYWPIAVTLALFVFIIYATPLLFLTVRVIIGPRYSIMKRIIRRTTRQGVRSRIGNTIQLFENTYMNRISPPLEGDEDMPPIWHMHGRELFLQVVARIMCLVSLWGTMIVFMECVGFLVDIACFTLMGILANAGTLLKYVTLMILILLYSYDIFKEVRKAYLKLNRALFADIQGRVEELRSITELPSYLQENRGFKAYELSEQLIFEQGDEILMHKFREEKKRLHWHVNDLCLFVDNQDMPRIPKKLFEEVCEIRVSGAPGPVYLSHIKALIEFFTIVFFLVIVFVIMKSLGEEYGLSHTTTTFATVIGGFLPYILRFVLKPKPPDLQLSSVSFRGRLDEKIKMFTQKWPLHDFPFEVLHPTIDRGPSPDAVSEGEGIDATDKKMSSDSPDNTPMHLLAGIGIAGALAGGLDDDKLNAGASPDDAREDSPKAIIPEEEPQIEAMVVAEDENPVYAKPPVIQEYSPELVVPEDETPLYAKPPKKKSGGEEDLETGNLKENEADQENETDIEEIKEETILATGAEPETVCDEDINNTSSVMEVDILIIPPLQHENSQNWAPEWSDEENDANMTEMHLLNQSNQV